MTIADAIVGLRHFSFLSADELADLFEVPPQPFARHAGRELLAESLGATLYSPATRPDLVGDLRRAQGYGLVSSVICLEDSIGDDEVVPALGHVVEQLGRLHDLADEVPLVFVRVREAAQVTEILDRLGPRADALSGFVLPKFGTGTGTGSGAEALRRVREGSEALGRPLWAMPVIETAAVVHRETRTRELLDIRDLLNEHRDVTLAVRIGATDLAAVYGLRRSKELTVYDLRVVSDAITDIVNVLGRLDGTGWPVSGAVWEYFSRIDRIFKPQLRQTPFREDEQVLRSRIIASELDGLIREVVLDRANGLSGKTVIHPTHVPLVHALSVVSPEDHADARAVLGHGTGGGVLASSYGNKMNEARPHRAWAERTLRRAAAFGVARDDVSFADLLAAVVRV